MYCNVKNHNTVIPIKHVNIFPIGPRSENCDASLAIESTNATTKNTMAISISAIGLNNKLFNI